MIGNADLLLPLNQGEIIGRGRHQELLEAGGFYYDLYMSQLRRQVDESDEELEEPGMLAVPADQAVIEKLSAGTCRVLASQMLFQKLDEYLWIVYHIAVGT
jgi:hypothetical protein